MSDISIVIPAHNEQENIEAVIKKVEGDVGVSHELIVVNDYSVDNTVGVVEGLCGKYRNLRLVHNTDKPGFANAIKKGFSEIRGDVVVPVMGDLCDDLHTINAMWAKIQEGYDVVCASRYIKGGARIGGSRIKGFFSRFAGWSLHIILGVPTHDIANAFKMYRKAVIENMQIDASGFEISMEMPLKAYYAGFLITELPTVWHERVKGKSSFKMLRLAPNYAKFYLWAVFRSLRRLLCQGFQ
jgi:glycosyltransferase involved in cell wall biosynthesis